MTKQWPKGIQLIPVLLIVLDIMSRKTFSILVKHLTAKFEVPYLKLAIQDETIVLPSRVV